MTSTKGTASHQELGRHSGRGTGPCDSSVLSRFGSSRRFESRQARTTETTATSAAVATKIHDCRKPPDNPTANVNSDQTLSPTPIANAKNSRRLSCRDARQGSKTNRPVRKATPHTAPATNSNGRRSRTVISPTGTSHHWLMSWSGISKYPSVSYRPMPSLMGTR